MQAREEQAADTLFGGGKDGNFVSNIFDGAACVVSSVIGGGNPKCHGKGSAVVEPPPYGGEKPGYGDDDNDYGGKKPGYGDDGDYGGKKPGYGDDGDKGGDKENTAYNYSYDTNKDGSLKVTVTLQKGGSCTYDIKADGKKVPEVVAEAAKRCLAEKK